MTRRSAAFPVVEVALATDHSFLVRAAGCSESATWNVGGPGGGGGGGAALGTPIGDSKDATPAKTRDRLGIQFKRSPAGREEGVEPTNAGPVCYG